jgi:phage/plasmid-associated DNA primase
MVTMTVKMTRGQVENCDKTIQAGILETIEGMHVDPEVYNFIIQTLATSVVGYRPRDKFQIWTGGGGNGKGLTKTIVDAAFGEYFYEPGQAMFSSRGVTATCLSSELAKLAGKRICMTSESEKNQDPSKPNMLRSGLLKQRAGHDKIQARDLWCSVSEFLCVENCKRPQGLPKTSPLITCT